MNRPPDPTPERAPTVFISHASEDRDSALKLGNALNGSGMNVMFGFGVIVPTASMVRQILDAISARDFVIFLISNASRESEWLRSDLDLAQTAELKDRSITLIPALIEPIEIPVELQHWQAVDLTSDYASGVEELIERIIGTITLDFYSLDAAGFEDMVRSLLVNRDILQFRPAAGPDAGYDFQATSVTVDPFGKASDETWYVEIKRRRTRIGLDDLAKFVHAVETQPARGRGLLVTNARMSSVARQFLAETADRSRTDIRVIEGPELKRLVASDPSLRHRFFPLGEGE